LEIGDKRVNGKVDDTGRGCPVRPGEMQCETGGVPPGEDNFTDNGVPPLRSLILQT